MKNILLAITIFMTLNRCNSTQIRKGKIDNYESYSLDASNFNNKVYKGKEIVISENTDGKTILIICDKRKILTDDLNKIIDTLDSKYHYNIITQKDSIKRYSDIKSIEKVVLIQ